MRDNECFATDGQGTFTRGMVLSLRMKLALTSRSHLSAFLVAGGNTAKQ